MYAQTSVESCQISCTARLTISFKLINLNNTVRIGVSAARSRWKQSPCCHWSSAEVDAFQPNNRVSSHTLLVLWRGRVPWPSSSVQTANLVEDVERHAVHVLVHLSNLAEYVKNQTPPLSQAHVEFDWLFTDISTIYGIDEWTLNQCNSFSFRSEIFGNTLWCMQIVLSELSLLENKFWFSYCLK